MAAAEIFLTDCLKECTWTLNERQSEAHTRENGGQSVTWGRPFWSLTARYENLSDAAWRALTAWIQRRKGARVSFTAYRPDRPAPLLNPAMTNTGLGLSSINISTNQISLTGLGSTVISPGDMVSFETLAGGRWIGETTVGATPVAGAATITVWPYPQTQAATPNVRLFQPLGLFHMTGQPILREPSTRQRSLEFQAKQIIIV